MKIAMIPEREYLELLEIIEFKESAHMFRFNYAGTMFLIQFEDDKELEMIKETILALKDIGGYFSPGDMRSIIFNSVRILKAFEKRILNTK